jgi:hypothetical protein
MILKENNINPNTASLEQIADIMRALQEQYLTVAFLLRSDQNQYGKLIENLEKDYTQGQDKYPKTVTAAYGLLTNWK